MFQIKFGCTKISTHIVLLCPLQSISLQHTEIILSMLLHNTFTNSQDYSKSPGQTEIQGHTDSLGQSETQSHSESQVHIEGQGYTERRDHIESQGHTKKVN